MPLYEYECSACKKHHEVMQKFSDEPLRICPDCGGPLQKLVSLSSFALKGSGWYTSDYKRKGQAPEAKEGAKAGDSKPETKPETKTDAKPETKTETAAAPAPKSGESKPSGEKKGT
jgi:putative FmdB family regulatory protein